jgi:hypothetical protein
MIDAHGEFPNFNPANKRYGPFKVLKEIGEAAYLLDLPKTWKAIHPVIHEEYLTLYHPPSFDIQRPPPPPPAVVVEGHIEHDVETILDSQTNCRRVQYLVKWTGYPREEATWESWGNVKNSPNLIKEFHTRYPTKPRDLKAVAQLQIRRINYDGWDPQLYHLRDGTPGESHTIANRKTKTDWTVVKPKLEIKKILERKTESTDLWKGDPTAKQLWLASAEDGYIDTLVFMDKNRLVGCAQLQKPFSVTTRKNTIAPEWYWRNNQGHLNHLWNVTGTRL